VPFRAAVLFSAGKDSALAALLLDRWCDVTLVTVGFSVDSAPDAGPGITAATEHAAEAAAALGFDHRVVSLDPAVAVDAAARAHADGYPRNAIQDCHEAALEEVAATDRFDAVADGTRRDDRVPTVERPAAQSLEDRHGVDYLAPLRGFGRGAVDRLTEAHLDVRTGPSDGIPKADYETAVRACLRREHGSDRVSEVFPGHVQSRVVGRGE
jgi:predicted subunit of tRNA(5-methylaminomethyl-2-thiouridylate) methyltransferase